MSKYLILFAAVGMLAMAGCSHDRKGEAKAYSAGCVDGINAVLANFGLQPKADAIQQHCDQAAQEFLKNSK